MRVNLENAGTGRRTIERKVRLRHGEGSLGNGGSCARCVSYHMMLSSELTVNGSRVRLGVHCCGEGRGRSMVQHRFSGDM